MPEGDSIHGVARRLQETLEGRALTRVAGTAPAVRRRAATLRGTTVLGVAAMGKHVLIDLEGGWSLRVHLGMSGRWRLGPPSGARGDGAARVVLETTGWSARCYGAPTVDLDRSPTIRAAIDHLGPDLLDPDADLDHVVERARRKPAATSISEVLLDQRVAAGIGNVYRNEVLYEAGVHPEQPLAELADERLRWLFWRAAAQLRSNVGRHRTTTGGRRRGSETYVYERAGRPCRRCGTTITSSRTTDRNRITYWCPACQPPPASSSAHRASSRSSTGGRTGSGMGTS